jgi:hypothetical protein
VQRVLKSSAWQRVDAVILLDGLHTADLAPFTRFASAAAAGDAAGPMLVMAHSQIVPPYVSTKTTNTAVMAATIAACPGKDVDLAPEYVTSAQLDAPITLGNQYGRHTFDHDVLVEQDNVGNAWRLEYEGNSAAIHIYIAQLVQPRLWRWLGERWNNPATGVFGTPAA